MLKRLVGALAFALVVGTPLPAHADEASALRESLGVPSEPVAEVERAPREAVRAPAADDGSLRITSVWPAPSGAPGGPPRAGLSAEAQTWIADGAYSVQVPHLRRWGDADCEEVVGVLDVRTGTAGAEWSHAEVEWEVYGGDSGDWGWDEIWADGTYEFEALFWCPELDGFGTFDLEMTLTFYDSSYDVVDEVYLSDDFRISRIPRATSKVTFQKKKYKAHGWKFPVRVTRAGGPWRNKRVELQVKLCGEWTELTADRTNGRGRVTFGTNPKAGWNTQRFCGVKGSKLRFRFYVEGNERTRASVSKVFRVVRR